MANWGMSSKQNPINEHQKIYFSACSENGAINILNPANSDDKICNNTISAPDITEQIEIIVWFLRKYSKNLGFFEFSLDIM